MFRTWLMLVAGFAALWPHVLGAQSVDRPKEDIQVGDAWVYERKDGTTGFHLAKFTSLVTKVSPKEIVTNAVLEGRDGEGSAVFDHDWNRLANGNLKYKPNDGHGVRWPLAVGKEWRHEFLISNTQTGANMKSQGLAKVVAKETITTPAGTFETYKIDRQMKQFNVADPSRSQDVQFLTWFAPEINHWARRTINVTIDKRLRSSTTDELVEIMKKDRGAGN
jgi:hypothetical protein